MPDHLTTEAKTAIDRADMDGLEQHAIGVAVHDALDRAVGTVTDRIGCLLGTDIELARVGNELARDRIVWSAGSIRPATSSVSAAHNAPRPLRLRRGAPPERVPAAD